MTKVQSVGCIYNPSAAGPEAFPNAYYTQANFNNKYGEDPMLAADLKLQAGSPCISAAKPNPVSNANIVEDFDGGALRDPTTPDIGAYEH